MGLMRRLSISILEELREAILPSSTISSLSDRLASLSVPERASVEQLAFLVHKSAAFQSDSYERIAKRMYPRMDQHKLNLVVELLQELDPRDASGVKLVSTQPDPSEKPKFDADILIQSVMQKMNYNVPKEGNNIDFSNRVTQEKPLRDYKQYAAKIDKEGVFENRQEFVDILKPNAQKVADELGIDARIVMAQAILETGYGRKVKGNNYLAIKSHGKANCQTFATKE